MVEVIGTYDKIMRVDMIMVTKIEHVDDYEKTICKELFNLGMGQKKLLSAVIL